MIRLGPATGPAPTGLRGMCDQGRCVITAKSVIRVQAEFRRSSGGVWSGSSGGLREISVLGGGDGTAAAMAILLHDRTWPEFDECLFMLMARLC